MYQIQGDSIVLPNGESYTFHELQFLRWELNGWRRLARVTQLKLETANKPDAVVFDLTELISIRDVLRLLDNKLPGYSVQNRARDEIRPKRNLR